MLARPWKLDFNAEESSETNDTPAQVVKSNRAVQLTGGSARLDVQLTFAQEADIKFTADAPQKWTVAFSSPALTAQSGTTTGLVDPTSGTVQLNLALDGSAADDNRAQQQQSATISFRLNLCSSSVCFQRSFAIEIPVVGMGAGDVVDGDSPHRIRAVLQKDSPIVGLVYDEKF